jgi:glycine betaine/proline transport system substrate-binding protein
MKLKTKGPATRRLVWVLAAIALSAAAPLRGRAADLTIGWTAWSDAEFTTKLAARLLEHRLGENVTLTLVDIALQYEGVARGDIDAMLMAWLPDTHADYYERYAGRFYDLGPLYTGAKLGWVVPSYVPKSAIDSISDLSKPEVANRLRREIYGIDAGAGLTRLSEQALKDYGLKNYNLITSSGAAMAAMVSRAEQGKRWIVATAWRPHWMFQKWDLRFLKDPKGSLGGPQRVDALVRTGLYREAPEAVEFLARMYIPLDELEAAIELAEETSYEHAVEQYITEHPKRVHYWVTGEIE